jgi:predicted dehydrogenase
MAMNNDLRVAIIGCGLIGQKRAKALPNARLVVCADLDASKATALAEQYPDCEATTDWHEAIKNFSVDIVIAAATNNTLAEIVLESIQAGKHILVEKPAARFSSELEEAIISADSSDVCVRVGFNHRFHPALQKAHEMIVRGEAGELMFIRARYGHGGRLGYEKEWRANPKVSGGGELLDQGVHLIDLSRWFLGDFPKVSGLAHTYYWDMPVDDNGFMLLQTSSGQTAFLHVSCTEWKNLFSFEIYGKKAKLHIEGLGGSYGVERLTFYEMLPQMGPPETTVWEYPGADLSWEMEFKEFLEDIHLKRASTPGLQDACSALKIVEKIYKESGYDYHS